MDNYRENINKVALLMDMSQNKPLNDIVYEGLRSAIILGHIPAGQRINEKLYAEGLNISRTPIRNAIQRLIQEEIVEYITNLGVVIKSVSVEDAEEIYQIRVALDTLASTNAMNKMSDDDFKKMDELLTLTEQKEEEGDVEQVINLFSDFNDMIYYYANMPRLNSIVMKLRDYLVRFRNISLEKDVRRKKALCEHRLIYRSMLNRDTEQLRLVISEHLNYYNSYLVQELIRKDQQRQRHRTK